MALLDDVKAVLITAGVGVTDTSSSSEWPIHLGFMPDGQDQVIALTELPGGQPETKWNVDFPAFQVIVRGQPYEYDTARTKIQAAFVALHNTDSTEFAGTDYKLVVGATSAPTPLGRDEQNRPSLAWTFNVIKQR
jgi:hypothetical protein